MRHSVGPRIIALISVILLLTGCDVSGLDNGLALTPPMGWLSWIQFGCNTNCTADPTGCLNDANIRAIADRMAADGFKKVGYEYVVIDDCWLAKSRGPDGRQVPDPHRFPNGMKALADYIHQKGLKFGIYTDIGVRTCAGYPASQFFLERDADTFSEWGVDYVKVDGCNADADTMGEGFKALGLFLNLTKRPMLYSCEWPAYELSALRKPNYSAIHATCNTWRTFFDMQPSWFGVIRTVDFWAADPFNISQFASPGAWNDPDMLVVGKKVLTPDQEAAQMSLWAMMAAPMMMSVDLRSISAASRSLLQHTGILSISQDRLGVQGKMVKAAGMLQFWRRPLYPSPHTFAVALLNTDPTRPAHLRPCLSDFGIQPRVPVDLFDVLSSTVICSKCNCTSVTLRPTSVSLMTVREH